MKRTSPDNSNARRPRSEKRPFGRSAAGRRLQLDWIRPSSRHARWVVAVLALLLIVPPSIAVAGPASPSPQVVDPVLARYLQGTPEGEQVRVLVEGASTAPGSSKLDDNSTRSDRAAGTVSRAGGELHGQLGLIGSVAASLTPAQIRQLSNDASVGRVLLDPPVHASALPTFDGGSTPVVFPQAVGAPVAWQRGYTGKGVGVALLDSGIADDPALGRRVRQRVDLVSASSPERGDPAGHGTHLAGIIAAQANGYRGVAPDADLVSVRVLDADGRGLVSTVIRGLEWTIRHRQDQRIRVAVLALSAPTTGSYESDPLAAAVEIAWHSGLVVVTASGNGGPSSGTVGSPGVDPLAITVGATDDAGTADTTDDAVPSFSGRGPTSDGLAKPDLVAPGRKIVSLRVPGSTLDRELASHREGTDGFRLTGTSMSTAVVAGVAADVLQQRPLLQPDQVKALLTRSATRLTGVDAAAQGAGSVNLAAALAAPTPSPSASAQGYRPADGLLRSILPLFGLPGREGQGDAVRWDAVRWDAVRWDAVRWDAVRWDAVRWDAVRWDAVRWDAVRWDAVRWDAVRWDAVRWDAVRWDAATGHGGWNGPLLD